MRRLLNAQPNPETSANSPAASPQGEAHPQGHAGGHSASLNYLDKLGLSVVQRTLPTGFRLQLR